VNQWREAYRQVRLEALRYGQKPRVAPDARRTSGDGIAGKDALGVEQVVDDFERGETFGAARQRPITVALAALVAHQFIVGTRIIHQALSERGEFRLLRLVSLGGCRARRRKENAGAGLPGAAAPNLMFPAALRPTRRELTPVPCSVRLSWCRRARPSTTLHEIQICGKADWNTYF
jgi:hypothetical protein